MTKQLELETLNKLFLELSQIVTAKTEREILLERSTNETAVVIASLICQDSNGKWAKIVSGLSQDFTKNIHSFDIQYDDGEICNVSIKFTPKGKDDER